MRITFFFCPLLALGMVSSMSASHLADAVEKKNQFEIEALLTKDLDLNVPQVDGMTALHWAVYHDDKALTQRLMNRGASAVSKNRYGVTPLYLACENGSAKLVRLLLDAGADPNSEVRGGETALMTAARTGIVGVVETLLKAGANIDAKERKDQSAIMWAASEGNLEVVKTLINAGADYQTPLRFGFTPFYFAIREGHSELVQYFLEIGENPNGAIYYTKDPGKFWVVPGTSPLILAIENGHYDLAVELLEAGADPNDMRTGFSPLHTLTWIRKPDIGESASGAPSPRGSGRRNSEDIARDLVDHGADVNVQLFRGHRAGGPRYRQNSARYSQIGATPFFLAADRADLPFIKLLLELGADPFIPNEDNCTALLVAAGIGSAAPEEEAGSEEEILEVLEFLLGLGMDINSVDENGETAMHGAAYKNVPEVVRFLYRHGHVIKIWNKNNNKDRTPLLIAEGYRPGNFKPSFATVEAIIEVMRNEGVEPPTGPKPKHTNFAN